MKKQASRNKSLQTKTINLDSRFSISIRFFVLLVVLRVQRVISLSVILWELHQWTAIWISQKFCGRSADESRNRNRNITVILILFSTSWNVLGWIHATDNGNRSLTPEYWGQAYTLRTVFQHVWTAWVMATVENAANEKRAQSLFQAS